MTIAIIPARGGSRRIPGKNARSFHGRPIIEYSLATACMSGLFDRIVVSTDSDAVAQLVEDWTSPPSVSVEVLRRAPELARDEVGTQEVVADALYRLGIVGGLACCIYPCAPLMRVEDLIGGREQLRAERHAVYVYSASQDGEDAGQWYWGAVEAFLGRVPLSAATAAHYYLPLGRVCDINTEADWLVAEKLYLADMTRR